MFIHAIDGQQVIIANNEDFSELKTYPVFSSLPDLDLHISKVDQQNARVLGASLNLNSVKNLESEVTWVVQFEENECIYRIFNQDHADGHFQPMAFSGDNLVYKFLDANIFGILT